MINNSMYTVARWGMMICTKNMHSAIIDFKKMNGLTSSALAAICVALSNFKSAKDSAMTTESDEKDFAACCDEYTKLTGFALSTSTSMRQAVALQWGPDAVQVYEYLLGLGYNSTTSEFWGHFLRVVKSIGITVTEVESLDFNV